MLEYLYTALRAEFGIYLNCADPGAMRLALLQEIKNSQDPDLEALTLTISPLNPQHLWIYRK